MYLGSNEWALQSDDFTSEDPRKWYSCYWSLALPAEAPLEHNFRYPRIRELTLDNDAIALGAGPRTF